jgi:hypothetical protein
LALRITDVSAGSAGSAGLDSRMSGSMSRNSARASGARPDSETSVGRSRRAGPRRSATTGAASAAVASATARVGRSSARKVGRMRRVSVNGRASAAVVPSTRSPEPMSSRTAPSRDPMAPKTTPESCTSRVTALRCESSCASTPSTSCAAVRARRQREVAVGDAGQRRGADRRGRALVERIEVAVVDLEPHLGRVRIAERDVVDGADLASRDLHEVAGDELAGVGQADRDVVVTARAQQDEGDDRDRDRQRAQSAEAGCLQCPPAFPRTSDVNVIDGTCECATSGGRQRGTMRAR